MSGQCRVLLSVGDVGQGQRGNTAALGLKCPTVEVSQLDTFRPCRSVHVIFAEVVALELLLESLLSQSCGASASPSLVGLWGVS